MPTDESKSSLPDGVWKNLKKKTQVLSQKTDVKNREKEKYQDTDREEGFIAIADFSEHFADDLFPYLFLGVRLVSG